METRDRNVNWLVSLQRRRSYVPEVVGSDYQPLGKGWESVSTDGSLQSRTSYGAAIQSTGGSTWLIICGGWDVHRSRRLGDLTRTNTCTGEIEVLECQLSPRICANVLVSACGRGVYIIGGDDGVNRGDIWYSSNGGQQFSCIADRAAWTGRSEYSIALVGDILVLCGGRDSRLSTASEFLDDVWISTNRGKTWSCICQRTPWSARAGSTLVFLNESLLLVGGYNSVSAVDDVWVSTDVGMTWTMPSVGRTPWKPRRSPLVLSDPVTGELLIIGGINEDGNLLRDSWASRDNGQTWISRGQIPFNTFPVVGMVTDGGELSILSNQEEIRSFSNLNVIRKDCRFVLQLGKKLEKQIPRDLWAAFVLPFTVDTRVLWKRQHVNWKQVQL